MGYYNKNISAIVLGIYKKGGEKVNIDYLLENGKKFSGGDGDYVRAYAEREGLGGAMIYIVEGDSIEDTIELDNFSGGGDYYLCTPIGWVAPEPGEVKPQEPMGRGSLHKTVINEGSTPKEVVKKIETSPFDLRRFGLDNEE